MCSSELTRREFAGTLAAGVAAPALVRRRLHAQPGRTLARFEILDAAGAPVPTSELDRFYLCDRRQQVFTSPRWRFATAKMKDQLAAAIESGNVSRIATALVRVGAVRGSQVGGAR